jgi:hypothetical protein
VAADRRTGPDEANEFANRRPVRQTGILQHRADPALSDGIGRRATKQPNATLIGPDQAEQDLYCGRVPSTVRAEQRHSLSRVDGER